MRLVVARIAIAKAIVLPALGRMLALARLAAVHAKVALRTLLIASRPLKPGHTLALAVHVIALAAVLALAPLGATGAKRARRTRMLARLPNVAGPAHVQAGHMVARAVRVGRDGALLLAAQPEGAGCARLRAIDAGPAAAADALAGERIARGVVQAAALVLAALAVAAGRALAAAVDS